MSWSEECQCEIDRVISTNSPRDVLCIAITRLIEAKIEQALYSVNLTRPSCDPAQTTDYCERLLAATLDLFEVKP